jgi:hypothetical protein
VVPGRELDANRGNFNTTLSGIFHCFMFARCLYLEIWMETDSMVQGVESQTCEPEYMYLETRLSR